MTSQFFVWALMCLAPARAQYCDLDPEIREAIGLPAGTCLDIEAKPATVTTALTWCCGFDGSGCVLVNYASDCDPSIEFVVSCDWGQSNLDGTITCYG